VNVQEALMMPECEGCEDELPRKMLEIDHIIPGEPETQLLCGDCNRIKFTSSMDVFRQRLAHRTEKDAQWLTELETGGHHIFR